jgi:hypothetical protein
MVSHHDPPAESIIGRLAGSDGLKAMGVVVRVPAVDTPIVQLVEIDAKSLRLDGVGATPPGTGPISVPAGLTCKIQLLPSES